MNSRDSWKILFRHACDRLDQAGLPRNHWSFGGGTVLMLKFNHRLSKDIDIFFRDQQLLSFVSPRINDAAEEAMINYSEHTNFTKIQFPEGEVDFIVSQQLTSHCPALEKVCGQEIFVDNPVEIIAKKIFFRADDFKARDVFDLAVVYARQKESLLQSVHSFGTKLGSLGKQLAALEESGTLTEQIALFDIAPGGEMVRGKEFSLCSQFIQDAMDLLQ